MQQHRQFTPPRHPGLLHAAPPREAQAPRFERRPERDPGQEYIGRFIQVAAEQRSATARPAPSEIQLAGLIAPRRQAHGFTTGACAAAAAKAAARCVVRNTMLTVIETTLPNR